MFPLRACLGCGTLHRNRHGRCYRCQQKKDQEKNQKAGYRRTRQWQELSKAARQAFPFCAECGSTDDLTTDHIQARSLEAGVQVLCRSCNGRKGNR